MVMGKIWLSNDEWKNFASDIQKSYQLAFNRVNQQNAASDELLDCYDTLYYKVMQLANKAREIGKKVRYRSCIHRYKPDLFQSEAEKEMYAQATSWVYHNFIFNVQPPVSSKKQKHYYAAIYELIRQYTGTEMKFFGPEFDDFLYNYCGILYNKGKDNKGRYRQVGTVWKNLFKDSTVGKEIEEYKQIKSAFHKDIFRDTVTKKNDSYVPNF